MFKEVLGPDLLWVPEEKARVPKENWLNA